MSLLMIFLGTIIGIIGFLIIMALFLYNKIKNAARANGFGSLKNLIGEIKKGEEEYNNNPKHVSGMTRLLKPTIEKDFPTFNESEIFNMSETSLRTIFNDLESLSVSGKLPLLNEQIRQIIEDFKSNSVKVRYDDVVFHAFAIKNYYKKNGVATIQVSTSLEYFYSKEKNNKIEYSSSHKKQTSYTVDFIYVYDITQIKDYTKVIGITCPNCGAAVKDLGNKVCRYCGSALEDVNLKNWMISSYHEDY